METVTDRIEKLVLSSGIPRRNMRRELAKISDNSYQAVAQWFNGVNDPGLDSLKKIAAKYRVSLEWLVSGSGTMESEDAEYPRPASEEDYTLIPQYDANGSCGPGALNGHVEVKGNLAFRKEWLQRMGLNGCKLSVIYAKGDSNYPTIEDGQVMLINHDDTTPRSGKLYLMLLDGELIVKRLSNAVTHWVISSDNQDKRRYPDITLTSDNLRDLHIDGRVVWRGGEL